MARLARRPVRLEQRQQVDGDPGRLLVRLHLQRQRQLGADAAHVRRRHRQRLDVVQVFVLEGVGDVVLDELDDLSVQRRRDAVRPARRHQQRQLVQQEAKGAVRSGSILEHQLE